MNGCSPDSPSPRLRQIIPAMSTPLTSIFGSGFLVIVLVLASGVGPYAILAMLAYIVSVCLYLHILSAFALGTVDLDSEFNKSLPTSILAILITLIGIFGGLSPLERLERLALYLTLAVVLLLILGFALHDVAL